MCRFCSLPWYPFLVLFLCCLIIGMLWLWFLKICRDSFCELTKDLFWRMFHVLMKKSILIYLKIAHRSSNNIFCKITIVFKTNKKKTKKRLSGFVWHFCKREDTWVLLSPSAFRLSHNLVRLKYTKNTRPPSNRSV